MQFRTEIEFSSEYPSIGYSDKLLMIGSCFSEHIGNWLEQHYFDVLVNPFGILYNPESIAHNLELLLEEKYYTPSDIFLHQGLFHSFDHHSRYSSAEAPVFLELINRKRQEATTCLKEAKHLLITFGTAWVYDLCATGQVVSNCHKLPERMFQRRRLSVDEIIGRWTLLIQRIKAINPDLIIHFTVSPIRHLKDTLHGNQLSKSTLLLAIDALQQLPDVCYFPAYEIIMDDLRDYRFYGSDLTHPSEMAVDYIREKFQQIYFTQETLLLWNECEKLQKALNHRPSNPNSAAYHQFLQQNLNKATLLAKKNPFFALQKPLLEFQQRLNTLS